MLDLFCSLFSEGEALDMSPVVQIVLTVIILAAAVLLVVINVIVLARGKKSATAEKATEKEPDAASAAGEVTDAVPAAGEVTDVEGEDTDAAEPAVAVAESAAIAETPAPTEIPEPIETPAPIEISEPVEAPAPIETHATEKTPIVGAKRIFVMYNRSFTAKLIQSDETVQARYSELKNRLLSYRKVGSRVGWKNDTFRYGRVEIGKFALRGKTLSLYLALDPADLAGTKYIFDDASEVKSYAATPVRLRLKSDRSVRWAGELVDRMMSGLGAEKTEPRTTDYSMPYETTEALIKRKLIKLLATGEVGTEAVAANFEALSREKFRVVTGLDIRESVTMTEAAKTITEEAAESLVIHTEKDDERSAPRRGNKKAIVNIDTLSENFAANDVVDLGSLTEKKIVGQSVGYVKILARGTLDKPLTVKAQDFSLDAVKMIVMTGGAAVLDE